MSKENINPTVFKVEEGERKQTQLDWVLEEEIDGAEEIDRMEVFELIRHLNDPEHPLTLEQLNVTQLGLINVDNKKNIIKVTFTPTIPHCSMATLIGLSITVKLIRSLPSKYKFNVSITPGTHASEAAINKQLNDKERVAAALENSHLLEVVNKSIAHTDIPQEDMRHSEKNVTSTCLFGDRVANSVLSNYRANSTMNKNQTCIAGVVSFNKEDNSMHCLSWGQGTKYLKSSSTDNINGDCFVRDMHAEILCKRALIRHIYDEVLNLCPPLILEKTEKDKWRLKDNISLHLYSSSTPCGNSAVRKWIKGKEEKFLDCLDENSWVPADHPIKHFPAAELGEISLLFKGSPKEKEEKLEYNYEGKHEEKEEIKEIKNFKEVVKPSDWLPPGVRLASEFSDEVIKSHYSCSDKILRWSTLSFLGSLLQEVIVEPHSFKFESITVGRKFLRGALERSLCCRGDWKKFKGKGGEEEAIAVVKHLSCMRTSVKFDESVVETTTAKQASFDDKRQSFWCFSRSKVFYLDGNTGLCLDDEGEVCIISSSSFFSSFKELSPTSLNYDEAKKSTKAYNKRNKVLHNKNTCLGQWITEKFKTIS